MFICCIACQRAAVADLATLMARIRTVKPEYWTDRRVGECSTNARLLFIATWNFADDEGGLDRSAKQLKAQAFPYDNLDCEPLVQELLNAGLLVEYESGGEKYLHIKNFRKHQRIDKPQKARIPIYESANTVPRPFQECSETIHGSKGMEGKGKERKGDRDRGTARLARAPTAKRLPEDFTLTDARKATAKGEGADPEREFAKFTDHWRAASGANARKHDWDAAWRNWCRKSSDMRANGRGHAPETPELKWRPPPDEDDANAGH